MENLTIQAKSLNLTEDEFFNFCQENDWLHFELTTEKEILVRTPKGTIIGMYSAKLNGELGSWNKASGQGYCFGPNAGFTLPNGSVRSTDSSFLFKERFEALDKLDRKRFAHICPDFVAEIRSQSDSLDTLKNKMLEYISNGCRLGWLIDTIEERAYIFKKDGTVTLVDGFNNSLSGEDVLVGFELDLDIFNS